MNGFEELSRELHSRSHDVDGHPIAFDSVKRSARRIQVRRRLAGGVVAAAVLSIAVPTAFAVNETLLNGQTPIDPATRAPSPSVTKSAAPDPKGGVAVLTTVGIPRGEDPKIDYLVGNKLVLPDDGSFFLEGDGYTAITPYGQASGWLAHSFDGSAKLVFLGPGGNVQRTQPGSTFAVNGSGSQVAYVTDAESADGQTELVLAPTNGSESAKVRLDVPASALPVGFVAEGAVVYLTEGQDTSVEWTRFDGTAEELPGLLDVGGATEAGGLVSGMTSVDELKPGSCSTVMQVESKERLMETCDFTLGQFSPDGQYVIGGPAYLDGIGDGEIAILDAQTGDVLAHFQSTIQSQAFVNNAVWEDDSHVLATVYQDGAWTIVRIGADGSIEAASDSVAGPDLDPAFFFSTQP